MGLLGVVVIGSRFRGNDWLKLFKRKENLILLGLITLTGMMDHYWLTLPQNSWLLMVILGII